LVIDDTAVPKKGKRTRSVSLWNMLQHWARTPTSRLVTLARGEVRVMAALRLFLPESWTSDSVRLRRVQILGGNSRGRPGLRGRDLHALLLWAAGLVPWVVADSSS